MKHFIVTLSFRVPSESIGDHLIQQHHAFYQEGYDGGFFLFYGLREPEEGSVVIARFESRDALAGFLAKEPLLRQGLATYDLVEFVPMMFPYMMLGWVDPWVFHTPFKSGDEQQWPACIAPV